MRPVRPARTVLLSWRRRPAPARDSWGDYVAYVEPVLGAQARVHRFASTPVSAAPHLSPVPIAAWVEGDGADAERTREALLSATVQPKVVLGGPLAQALATTRCSYVLLMRAGDVPAPLALERLGQALAVAHDATVLTCDEDVVAADGFRTHPRFHPGPSPDRWLACDDSGCQLLIARKAAAEVLPEMQPSCGWRHELAMALGGPGGERHAHVPLLLSHRAQGHAVPGLSPAAATNALRRWEPRARFEQRSGVRRVRRPIGGEPSVEIIVCFRDKPELTERCADSVLEMTDYENLRLTLVDNGSVQTETKTLLARLSGEPRVRVIRDLRPFNFAALNNSAAAGSGADVLLFLNNDAEVVHDDWLEPLLEEATRPQVGAVAPMLLYPNGTVQHAGAAVGLHGYAGHPFAGLDPDAETPFGRASEGTRNWLAVSAACMMIERRKFEAVGGFDESFVVAGNDVDLCLRLTAAGFRSLCVPHSRLLHDESSSRGAHIDPGDFAASERSYGEFRTVGDPFYNPNLTLRSTDCRVRAPDEALA